MSADLPDNTYFALSEEQVDQPVVDDGVADLVR